MRTVSLTVRIMAAALAAAVTIASYSYLTGNSVQASWMHREAVGGSAGSIEGRTVVVTLFADEADYKWDFTRDEDVQRRETVNRYLDLACDYIELQVALYGKRAEFVTDFEENPDLYYRVRMDLDWTCDMAELDFDGNNAVMWNEIERLVDVDAVKEAHDADNVVFFTVFNTDEANQAVTCTRNWYAGMESEYEVVYLYYVDYELVNPPAVYAHEILHTFGAPDLYQAEEYFGITNDNFYNLQRKCMNDIMLTCSDPVTGRYVYDRIPNMISYATAYYIYLV